MESGVSEGMWNVGRSWNLQFNKLVVVFETYSVDRWDIGTTL